MTLNRMWLTKLLYHHHHHHHLKPNKMIFVFFVLLTNNLKKVKLPLPLLTNSFVFSFLFSYFNAKTQRKINWNCFLFSIWKFPFLQVITIYKDNENVSHNNSNNNNNKNQSIGNESVPIEIDFRICFFSLISQMTPTWFIYKI